MPFFDTLPGETPIDDISGLKIRGITRRSELSIHEAENILNATIKYLIEPLSLDRDSFDYSFSLQLHREMFGDVWAWAGQLRRAETNIGVPPIQIEHHLYNLFGNVPYWASLSWMEQVARLHHGAVYIHPFTNGNGRWSRMLVNIWLRLNDQPITRWPETTLGDASTIRGDYLTAMRNADQGDFDRLIELHTRYTMRE